MNYTELRNNIKRTHKVLQIQAGKSVNILLSARNWIIGFYIVEFQQNGNDRANYGDNLINELSKEINISGLSSTNLKLSRQFYLLYPQLHQAIIGFIEKNQLDFRISFMKSQSATDQFKIVKSQSATDELQIEPLLLLNKISFTHIVKYLFRNIK